MNMYDAASRDADLESLTQDLQRRTEDLEAVRVRIGALCERAESRDRLVRVEVDASGAIIDVQLALDAFGRTTPAALAASMIEASARAASGVRQRGAQLLSAATEQDPIPDLPDIVPGAPSLAALLGTAGDSAFAGDQIIREPRHSAQPRGLSILREANHG